MMQCYTCWASPGAAAGCRITHWQVSSAVCLQERKIGASRSSERSLSLTWGPAVNPDDWCGLRPPWCWKKQSLYLCLRWECSTFALITLICSRWAEHLEQLKMNSWTQIAINFQLYVTCACLTIPTSFCLCNIHKLWWRVALSVSSDLKKSILPFNLYLFTWKSLQRLTKLCWRSIRSAANQMCTSFNHNSRSLIGAFKTNAFREHAHAGLRVHVCVRRRLLICSATMHFCTQAQHHRLQRYVNKTITRRLSAIFGSSCLFSYIRHPSSGCICAVV